MKWAILLILLLAPLCFAVEYPNHYCGQYLTSCVKQCCPSVPTGNWDEAQQDCIYDTNTVSDEQAMQICGTCVDEYAQCDATYNSDGSLRGGYTPTTPSSSSSGCCGGLIALIALPLLFIAGMKLSRK